MMKPMFDFSVEEGEQLTISCTIQNPESLVNIENGNLVLTKEGINLMRELDLFLLINNYVSYSWFLFKRIFSRPYSLRGIFFSSTVQHIIFIISYRFFYHATIRNMAQRNLNGRWFRCIHMFIYDLSRSSVCLCLCHCHCTRWVALNQKSIYKIFIFFFFFVGKLS